MTLMVSIQLACKTIALAVRKAGIAGLQLEGSVNVSGDSVKKLIFSPMMCLRMQSSIQDIFVCLCQRRGQTDRDRGFTVWKILRLYRSARRFLQHRLQRLHGYDICHILQDEPD